jgi:deazaflavin-dependent oxidoreductase (nitroreductase family)
MVAPRWLARANRVGLNRVTRRFANRLPNFGLLTHVGRKSGKAYSTPVNVFRTDDGHAIALTYGPASDWVRNVQAAGGCTLLTRGHPHILTGPTLRRDPDPCPVPALPRLILNATNTHDYLYLSEKPAEGR